MSGFSAEWLALREPADHAARNRDLLTAAAAAVADRQPVHVLDLGCGTGSNLRATAPQLGPEQYWRLVDHDVLLLAKAREELRRWADATLAEDAGALVLSAAGRRVAVSFIAHDLSGGIGPLLVVPTDLVTAAALFDLVSPAWIEAFVQAVAAARLPFYTALTYDGREAWEPPHPHDEAVHGAFLAHQQRDKGFGPAAGPRATGLLADGFRGAGYTVSEAASPWRLTERERSLVAMLADGTAAAVGETGQVAADRLAAWRAARAQASRCLVGHADLLAVPTSGDQ
ncbi:MULTISPECIES: class I SAM-dependent methyltransferase [unclassified Chelatococcus]|uniref:class I SAM-dependent methyltransferase n=1 Tax=unclassified Chelatococcus TaxID=2638111 RepID=UPI0002FAC3E4|nr:MULTISPECIES: class I SAM-dependent methyltransferase [unclassified Chelatococcus]ALA16527.1 hypothetical protein AL346_02755 [Chelatococcus sp. CO-6]